LPRIEEALALAEKHPRERILLGGERQGERIDDFDLGNSPRSISIIRWKAKRHFHDHQRYAGDEPRPKSQAYLPGRVRERLGRVQKLIGADEVHLLCAGTDGEFGEDDIMLAGLIVERLQQLGGRVYELNAQATTAREYWMNRFALPQALGAEPIEPELLAQMLRASRSAKSLIELGYDDDILAAAASTSSRACRSWMGRNFRCDWRRFAHDSATRQLVPTLRVGTQFADAPRR